ncbi:hypothetical protein [Erwinia sorbitola]|uniref:Uncharacterized protein n=1 Tax=Erwinia sorbitola TaxID=2681984 RepID=A0A6I6EKW7_9GAMM|nr:hypothetical protein [Erwinia sorbitola]MTD26488.1 hypothetical protein [Erwinia sorbitola]QGU86936.1 hypothetical protein GN242_06800 [Erwinia sorbitola]
MSSVSPVMKNGAILRRYAKVGKPFSNYGEYAVILSTFCTIQQRTGSSAWLQLLHSVTGVFPKMIDEMCGASKIYYVVHGKTCNGSTISTKLIETFQRCLISLLVEGWRFFSQIS